MTSICGAHLRVLASWAIPNTSQSKLRKIANEVVEEIVKRAPQIPAGIAPTASASA